ncbi:MAG: universal stress protein [Planctomycetota bacterium]
MAKQTSKRASKESARTPSSRKASSTAKGAKVTRVLCAMDLTATSHLVLAEAAELAQVYDAHLDVVHVVEQWDKRYDFLVDDLTKSLTKEAKEKVQAELARLSKTNPVPVNVIVKQGSAVDEIAKAMKERKPDMLVIGAYGGEPDSKEPLGTVAERLLALAPCSVLVYRPCPSTDIERILCATDGSPTARIALDWALDLAAREGLKSIDLVNAYQVPTGYIEAGMTYETARAKMKKLHDEDVAKILSKVKDFPMAILPVVDDGPAAEVVCQNAEARRADLIVIGSRGRSVFARFLLGSVTTKVVRNARTPVLVVKDETHKVGFIEALLAL